MKSDTPLEYAVFQLSPNRSRCELFVSSSGNTEKLASGLLKPFITHLKFAEEQFASAVPSLILEVEKHRNAETWFTKGTLERFVRFVSTPEVLELVNTLDAEMSQLEAARKIYSQGVGDQFPSASGGDATGATAAADATKKELLRAIDVRLVAVKQDLTTACSRASAAGFNPDTVTELQLFADRFGAHRLNEACTKYTSLFQRRPDLINPWKPGPADRTLRSSSGSDMSLDDPTDVDPPNSTFDQSESSTWEQQQPKPSFSSSSIQRSSEKTDDKTEEPATTESPPTAPPARRLSVQDRINLFENKQKESSGGAAAPAAAKPVVGKSVELRRLSSDVSEKAVLRRWSGVSDMSIDLSFEKKEAEGSTSTTNSSEVKNINKEEDLGSNSETQLKVSSARIDNIAVKVETVNGLESKLSLGRHENQTPSLIPQFKPLHSKTESFGLKTQASLGKSVDMVEGVGQRDQISSSLQFKQSSRKTVDVGSNSKDSAEGGNGQKLQEAASLSQKILEAASQAQSRTVEGDQLATALQWGHGEKKGSLLSEAQYTDFAAKVEESGFQRMKLQRQVSGPEQLRKLRDNKVPESEETLVTSFTVSVEQVQRARQSKGNQELNDELKMKANELEKLFAEHKLRVPSDQSVRSKPSLEVSPQLPEKVNVAESSGSSSNTAKLNAGSVMKTVDRQDYDDTPSTSFGEVGVSDDFRGKFYDMYMQKRDAKLRDDWVSKKEEKEAKLKAMHDSLERNRAEMKAKFSGSVDRSQDSIVNARRRAEKLRSFNSRSAAKREQQPIESLRSENRNTSLSTPRTSIAVAPRPSAKASNSSAGKRRLPSENPLAQSVPNFSDFRKENTKPSSGVSKTTPRSQLRNYPRNKNTNEDEKPRRSQSLRKSSANPIDFKELSSLSSDSIVLTPLKYDKEQMEQTLFDRFPKRVDSKPFLRKGNGIGPGAGAGIAKLKASMASESLENEEDSDGLPFEQEDTIELVKEEEREDEEEEEYEEVFETVMAKDSADMDNENPRMSQGSDKSENSLRSLSPVDPTSVAELSATMSSTFDVAGHVQESPGESPMSWNSRMHHSFSYPHEISDIDASMDSPMGSPASWNSHSLTQTEADAAARMRKKWGSAQKPILLSNTSHNQSRKDMTKGFKRLLKFGRKSRGTETLVDWISATTSEGDDDTEDGRDLANRSSEDLRKTRMGFPQGHPSDDGFNESELFTEQVQALHSSIPVPPANFKLREDNLSGSSLKAPRSFFSTLSSFRSKASDSKPR